MKISLKFLSVLALIAILTMNNLNAQVVNEATKKKISFGVGLFTDIWQNTPSNIDIRPVNQGFQAFGMYNTPFGKSNFGFSIGLGIAVHNMYGDFILDRHTDTVFLQKIPDSTDWKKSKITLSYLELPIEFNFKSNNKISVGLGFKLSMLVGSNTKYKGEANIKTSTYQLTAPGQTVRFRTWGIKSTEQFAYGPTLRVGYKWFNVNAYYMLSTVFKKNLGPEIYPISVGFVIMPF